MQGIILFCVLGGELLIRYRIRFGRTAAAPSGETPPPASPSAEPQP